MASEQIQIPRFLAGDIIMFAGTGDLYSKVGSWMMRGPGEGPTYAVHMAQFLCSRRVLEMDFRVKIKSLDEVLKKGRGFEVWRCRTLSDAERQALTRQALVYTRVRFGMLKFLGHLFDTLISKIVRKDIYLLRPLVYGYPVCSGVTAIAYEKALGYRFGVPPQCADPDQIHDWVKAHPAEWVRVFRLEGKSHRRLVHLEDSRTVSPARAAVSMLDYGLVAATLLVAAALVFELFFASKRETQAARAGSLSTNRT